MRQMENKWWYLIGGVVIGWITKVPFLIKWYKDLRGTKNYRRWWLLRRYNISSKEFNLTDGLEKELFDLENELNIPTYMRYYKNKGK